MKSSYRNPTAEQAIGSMSKEWKKMARLALQIREGRGNPLWVEQNTSKFTGIFRRLLEDPIEEVQREAH